MANISDFTTQIIQTLEITIANGQTKSTIFHSKGATLKTIILPAAFDGTEITFEISDDGTNFYEYRNIDNDIVTITCTQGKAYGLGAIDFYSIDYLKIVSNASESGDRTLKLIMRGY